MTPTKTVDSEPSYYFFFKKDHSQRGHTCLTIAKTRNNWEYLDGELMVSLIRCVRAFAGRTRNTVPACEGDSELVTLTRIWVRDERAPRTGVDALRGGVNKET